MRKLVLFLHASLDGFVEGPNGEMDIGWISYDADLEQHAKGILSTANTVIWGRGTYQMMHSYWPSVPSNPSASQYEREHAEWIEKTEKIVFSTTLDKVEWNNSKLVRENVAEEIIRLKQQPGEDMVVLGSPRFAHHLMQLDLIDTYKITVSPVLIGDGLPLFQGLKEKVNLKLIENKTFDSGAVGLVYDAVSSEN
ncbi:dihydrofolate reductase family protein [Paenibacillus sp. IB182496]|uniref:Dihydrofolate reductase family protein n=1 Tax=Paenibacillus sabuli TaxID=2772509 RepID=A0A927BZY2_9BACL|nr:dihydrofolate reductase family protein [Paenibacillus sabuli]MBD2848665.1 dihydrofolate reductase family protein [Paenibacillus sabuli]